MRQQHRRQMKTQTGASQVRWYLIVALLLTALVSACATAPPIETHIKARAQARWDALLSQDYDTAYSMYSPGYRSSSSRVDFEISLRIRRVQWLTAEVQESSCDADVCTVQTLIGYTVSRPVPGLTEWKNKRQVSETWVRTQGQWWYTAEE